MGTESFADPGAQSRPQPACLFCAARAADAARLRAQGNAKGRAGGGRESGLVGGGAVLGRLAV